MPFNSGIRTNQILTNDNEVCIPRLSSILLAVLVVLSKLQLSWDPLYLNAGAVSTNYEPNLGTYGASD